MPSSFDRVLCRLIDLVREDAELKLAIIDLMKSHSEVNIAKAAWYNRRASISGFVKGAFKK